MDCKNTNPSRLGRNIKRIKRTDSKEHATSTLYLLKAKYKRLVAENQRLKREIADLEGRGISTNLTPLMQSLHDYNDMKDVTQEVLGYLANTQNVTIVELHKRYGLPLE